MSKNKSINARQYEQIKEVTDQGCISMGEWVRNAIDTALKNWPSEEEQTDGN